MLLLPAACQCPYLPLDILVVQPRQNIHTLRRSLCILYPSTRPPLCAPTVSPLFLLSMSICTTSIYDLFLLYSCFLYHMLYSIICFTPALYVKQEFTPYFSCCVCVCVCVCTYIHMYIYELHSCFTPSLLQRTYVESKAIYRNITSTYIYTYISCFNWNIYIYIPPLLVLYSYFSCCVCMCVYIYVHEYIYYSCFTSDLLIIYIIYMYNMYILVFVGL
jgi:hypothetical protein